MAKKGPTRACGTANSPKGEEVVHVSKAPCSVELSRDAKGVPKWTIKLYVEKKDASAAVDHLLSLDAKFKKELYEL